MGRFKNRIWTRDEYLMKYKSLNGPKFGTKYYRDAVLLVRYDGILITTQEQYDIYKEGDAPNWTLEFLPINNFKFVETIDGVIMCEAHEAKEYLKKGVSDCKKGHRINT